MIPIGDSPRSRSKPWVTWAFLLANVAVFAYMLTLGDQFTPSSANPVRARAEAGQLIAGRADGVCYHHIAAPTEIDEFFCRWAFQPREFIDTLQGDTDVSAPQPAWQVYLTLLTSLFMHAGWLHILGNLLFLWIFGDNVEDRMGHFRYLLFYLAAGLVATFAQAAIDTSSAVPNVGASGAIAGVLGAYIVVYPTATVRALIPFFPLFFFPLPVPAFLMIGIWFAQNLLSGIATLGTVDGGGAGVAFFAHIGGFIFGAAVALVFLAGRKRPPPRWDDRRAWR